MKLKLLAAVAASMILAGCESLDSERIPPMPVSVVFQSVGMWETYGVPGATDFRYFIISEARPAGFPYTALSYTGYGGILLVADILGEPQAYDLSCPVEVRQNVRVKIDRERNIAVCPVCHSEYDVFSNFGTPIYGPAVERHYAMTRYRVFRGTLPLEYYRISR